MYRGLIVVMMSFLLAACGGTAPGIAIPKQEWNDIVIEVRTQPEPVQPGMNEFLILATEKRGRPVHDLLVSIRVRGDEPWRQAIQDGFSGVYRHALAVSASDAELAVKIRAKGTGETTELHFQLHATNPVAP